LSTSLVRLKRRALLALFLFWLAVVGCGLGALWKYAETPGPVAAAPEVWPAGARVARDPIRPTLILFAHPRCACSRATIGELSVLMTHVQGRVATRVLFFTPSGGDADWTGSDLWSAARAIPGVTVESDENGIEAARFGSETSGQVLLYSADGRLLFKGGITAARGHAGDNAGRTALTSLLVDERSARAAPTPVFGCPLRRLATQ
jgi:hypothetical protein